jgi:hypothetical protein
MKEHPPDLREISLAPLRWRETGVQRLNQDSREHELKTEIEGRRGERVAYVYVERRGERWPVRGLRIDNRRVFGVDFPNLD